MLIHAAEEKNALVLPVEAVNEDRKGSYCMVLRDGIVERRDVETGLSNETMIQIKKGLQEGETVINDQTAEITEGMQALSMEGLSAGTPDEALDAAGDGEQ